MFHNKITVFINIQDSNTGFLSLIEGLLDDIFHVSSLVHRVASYNGSSDYQAEVEEQVELSDARDEILNRVSTFITQVCAIT